MKLFAVVLLFAVAAALPDLQGDRVLRLRHENVADADLDAVRQLISELDVWGHAEDGGLELRAPKSIVPALLSHNINVTDVTGIHMDHFKWMEENDATQVCRDSECFSKDTFYNTYQSYNNIQARFQMIAERDGHLAELFSWGQSHQGTDMRGMRITAPGSPASRPVAFYFCGQHAREWIPPMFCTFMADELTARFGRDPRVTAALQTYEFYILPVMNPDGYQFSMTGSNNMWRKSRLANSGSNCVGTDLNRNWVDGWGGGGSSNNPCSETYRGRSAYDNVETERIRHWIAALTKPVAISMDIHAYGQMWMHPWGKNTQLSPDNNRMQQCGDASAVAIRSVNGLTFATGTVARVIYQASGVSVDSTYARHGVIFSYTPEVRGSSFQPPASNINPSNAELWAGMLAQVECVSFFRANPEATEYKA